MGQLYASRAAVVVTFFSGLVESGYGSPAEPPRPAGRFRRRFSSATRQTPRIPSGPWRRCASTGSAHAGWARCAAETAHQRAVFEPGRASFRRTRPMPMPCAARVAHQANVVELEPSTGSGQSRSWAANQVRQGSSGLRSRAASCRSSRRLERPVLAHVGRRSQRRDLVLHAGRHAPRRRSGRCRSGSSGRRLRPPRPAAECDTCSVRSISG